jgi:hypothetical protein
MTTSRGRRACEVAVLLALLALAAPSAAADAVAKMIERLKNHDDFRVRTQAALALGAAKSKRAVAPLCAALDDDSATVRAAAAAAIGRLGQGGADCLERRRRSETSASVKTVIDKALAQSRTGGDVLGITKATKFYVAIGTTTDKTRRKKGQGVHDIVRAAIQEAAQTLDGYVLAPDGESKADAEKLLKNHKRLRAFLLWPKVDPPKYAGQNLTVRLELAIFTYPAKSLKGTLAKKLTMTEVEPGDTESEDELIKTAAMRAFEEFSKHAEEIQ